MSLGWEDPWRREWLPTPVFLPGESHGQRSLAGYSPWSHKESDMTEATEHRCMRRADGSKCCQLAPEFTLGKVYSFKENIVMKYVDKER